MKETHLETTFTEAERHHPDLMEPYSGRLAEARSFDDRRSIMEAGTRAKRPKVILRRNAGRLLRLCRQLGILDQVAA